MELSVGEEEIAARARAREIIWTEVDYTTGWVGGGSDVRGEGFEEEIG